MHILERFSGCGSDTKGDSEEGNVWGTTPSRQVPQQFLHSPSFFPQQLPDNIKSVLRWHLEMLQMILVTFETFDRGGEKTWPDQQKGSDKDKHNDNGNDNYI